MTGFKVSEDDDELVIREPAGGKEIKIAQDDIDDVKKSSVSAMPAGLVNQLENREQFSDLVKFLIDINEGGASRLAELKKAIE